MSEEYSTDEGTSQDHSESSAAVDPRKAIARLVSSLERSRYNLAFASSVARQLAELATDKLLISLMRDKKAMIRFAAVEAFRHRDGDLSDAVIDHLLSRIDDRHDTIAAAAITVLGEKKVESTLDEILDCVTMDNSRVACASMEALYELSPEEAKPHFDEFIDHGDFPRVASVARIIQKFQLSEHLDRLLVAAEQLADELNPQLDRNNPWTIERRFMMEIVDVLASFKHQAAIPLLQRLGSNYVGLRTHSLQALQAMGVDVSSMIEEALERKPSRGLRTLLTGEDEEQGGFDGPRLLKAYAAANQEILSNSDVDALLNSRVSGHAVEVLRHQALIELSNGLHAILQCEDLHWTCLRNLKPYAERLTESREYIITEVNAETGYVGVSHKAAFANPWLPDSTFFKDVAQGQVEASVRGGLLVQVSEFCIGFLPVSSPKFGEVRVDQQYQPGDNINVRVESADPESCRITLAIG